jgi:hypothetical protein
MTEQELQDYLIGFVREFTVKRNTCETSCFEASQAAKAAQPKFDNREDRFAWLKENPQTNWFDEFRKLLDPLYVAYVTDKKRVYGGTGGHSFGFPPKFTGMESPLESKVELKNKNRAEVYFRVESRFDNEYLFVVLRKADEWKIDSYKSRRFGKDEKWDNKIL